MADDSKPSQSTSEFIQHLNVQNAKIIAVLMVIGFIIYHGIIHYSYSSDSCKWLLSDGRFQGYHVWQPYGCMMHTYSQTDGRMCMRYINYWGGKNHIVFVGDSRIRQLYMTFVRHISTSEQTFNEKEKFHQNLIFSDNQLPLKVEFLWHPMVDFSMYETYQNWLKQPENKRPNVIVTGSATWSIKMFNGSEDALDQFKGNLTRILPLFENISLESRIVWMLQDPVIQEKLQPQRAMITNEQIDSYNKAAMEILRYSKAEIWSSSRLVAQGYNEGMDDGLHIGKVALGYNIQILLNMYCNDEMNYNDGTCCRKAEPVTKLQIVTFSVFGVSMALAIGMIICRWRHGQNSACYMQVNDVPQNKSSESLYILVTSMSKLGIIMAYFFLCDRTNFFMKENKYYTHLNFFLPFAYVFALGIFFTEESSQTALLHRDQTDEWKGWMQLVILIYHMTGASQVLPIYMHVRVLVTSYLFLTGYGHFTYLWHKGDYGLFRLCQVLFRLNMLVVLLCLVMNRPYQFYYFVPLVSFWFLVVYITMAMIPQITSSSAQANNLQYLYVILKFVGLFSIVTILYLSEVFFEKIFVTRPWKALFVSVDDSIREWWFRWQLDRYSVTYGMLVAFAYYLLKHYKILDDINHGNLFSRSMACSVSFLSVLGLGSYAAFALLCRNKPECNEVHPYISFIPITSYILLRNMSGIIRTRYSTFFAWFGKISLELFITQYHIWLAADTHGVLVLVPSYPVLNVMITSFIFVCVAHEIHQITFSLLKHAIPSDWKYLVRNVLIFSLILVPIGISDGMF